MPPESNVESTLIWYKGNDEKNWKYWADEIDRFLEGERLLKCNFDSEGLCLLEFAEYKKPGQTAGSGQNKVVCDFNNPPPEGKTCDVPIRNWSPCVSENNYNYHKNGPCIFLKLNKVQNPQILKKKICTVK